MFGGPGVNIKNESSDDDDSSYELFGSTKPLDKPKERPALAPDIYHLEEFCDLLGQCNPFNNYMMVWNYDDRTRFSLVSDV